MFPQCWLVVKLRNPEIDAGMYSIKSKSVEGIAAAAQVTN
jgi:hypothetical protein